MFEHDNNTLHRRGMRYHGITKLLLHAVQGPQVLSPSGANGTPGQPWVPFATLGVQNTMDPVNTACNNIVQCLTCNCICIPATNFHCSYRTKLLKFYLHVVRVNLGSLMDVLFLQLHLIFDHHAQSVYNGCAHLVSVLSDELTDRLCFLDYSAPRLQKGINQGVYLII